MENELPLTLFAVSCLLLALESYLDETASKDSKQVVQEVYTTVLCLRAYVHKCVCACVRMCVRAYVRAYRAVRAVRSWICSVIQWHDVNAVEAPALGAPNASVPDASVPKPSIQIYPMENRETGEQYVGQTKTTRRGQPWSYTVE